MAVSFLEANQDFKHRIPFFLVDVAVPFDTQGGQPCRLVFRQQMLPSGVDDAFQPFPELGVRRIVEWHPAMPVAGLELFQLVQHAQEVVFLRAPYHAQCFQLACQCRRQPADIPFKPLFMQPPAQIRAWRVLQRNAAMPVLILERGKFFVHFLPRDISVGSMNLDESVQHEGYQRQLKIRVCKLQDWLGPWEFIPES